MATTTTYGWPKPALTDAPNGPAQIGALGDAIDSTLTTAKVGYTPLAHNTGLTLSASTGWGSLDYQWERANGNLYLLVEVARTGGTITAAASGNISNTTLATLGSRLPHVQVPVMAYLVTAGIGGACVLSPGGSITLLSIQPSGTVANGDVVRAYFSYAN